MRSKLCQGDPKEMDLFVSYNGRRILITNTNFQYAYSKEIFAEIDLDRDGYKELILRYIMVATAVVMDMLSFRIEEITFPQSEHEST